MKIAYTFVISDLFHYGHLQLLESAANISDMLVCGVLTDEAVNNAGGPPISNFFERSSVIKAVKFVDEILPQHNQDPFDNLFLLRKRFPNDEIIFVYGENWGEAPGGSSLNKINITLKQQSFYKKLSNNQIACKIVEKYYPNLKSLDTFTERFVIEDFDRFTRGKPKFTVTTKANTLQKLKPLLKKSFIEKTYVFTVEDWKCYQREIIEDIQAKFSNGNVVVRSSCLNEDTLLASKAGHFQSFLNIKPQDTICLVQSIEKVIASYSPGEADLSDQVLVQHYTTDVMISGVLFNRDLVINAPYYVINYDTGSQTDTVTSGQNAHLIKIFKHIHKRTLEPRWQKLLQAVDEIEHIIPEVPLDIEFAIKNNNDIVIFQVRPLSANISQEEIDEDHIEDILNQQIKSYHSKTISHQDILQGTPLVYSDMAFWNPSELIGCQPKPLAYDLFNVLFMEKAWQEGLISLGYHRIHPKRLMDKFCNKPYINVNAAFLSLIPSSIPEKFHHPLYQQALQKLKDKPYLHDKVEFEILFTCFDFTLEKRLAELKENGFSEQDINTIYQALISFTCNLINDAANIFGQISQKLNALEENHRNILKDLKSNDKIDLHQQTIIRLLSTCEELGAIPFASAARLAFVAESLLRSLKETQLITSEEHQLIKQSFSTVAFEITDNAAKVAKGLLSKEIFMQRYGHLRAGTYDITQARYDQSDHFLFDGKADEIKRDIPEFVSQKINHILNQSPLNTTFDCFYYFIKTAIELREYVKLSFTKVISDVLELSKMVGGHKGLNVDDLSFCELNEVLNLQNEIEITKKIKDRRRLYSIFNKISLPAIIMQQDDYMKIECFKSRPNFVTEKSVEAKVIVMDRQTKPEALHNKIVFIESADPGYHWILAHQIAGLVTKYGGAASHMAICTAEMNIPAAIGCGSKYEELKNSKVIRIDCLGEIIERVH